MMSNRDFTTWHDRKPSHPQVPDAIRDTRAQATEAWHMRELAFDNYQAGFAGRLAYDVLDQQAHRLQDELEQLLAGYHSQPAVVEIDIAQAVEL